jgi:hypothetical protein
MQADIKGATVVGGAGFPASMAGSIWGLTRLEAGRCYEVIAYSPTTSDYSVSLKGGPDFKKVVLSAKSATKGRIVLGKGAAAYCPKAKDAGDFHVQIDTPKGEVAVKTRVVARGK